DLEVAERVDARAIARLDHGGRVELLDDRRAREQGARSELLPAEGGGVLPGPVEPRAPPSGGRDRAAGRAVDGEEAVQRDGAAPADDGGPEADELRAHLTQLDLEAVPVRFLEAAQEVLAREVGARDADAEDVGLPDELHVRL